jgi:flagellar M-ring protein FliF
MDFSRVSETSERYDPEGRVVRSTATTEETSSSTEGADGVTAGANVPDGTAPASAGGPRNANNSSQETVNYEISRTTRTEISEGGRIRRLSVAVAVDGVTAPAEGENAQPQYQPRSDEEMQRLTQLVRSAVGFNAERGDVVEVVNTQFARTAPEGVEAESGGLFNLGGIDPMRIIEIAAALIASLAFVFFVLRPLIAGLMNGGARAAAAEPPAIPGAQGAVAAAALPSPETDEIPYDDGINIAQINGRVRASSVKKVAEVVNLHPDQSAQIIRGWINNAM